MKDDIVTALIVALITIPVSVISGVFTSLLVIHFHDRKRMKESSHIWWAHERETVRAYDKWVAKFHEETVAAEKAAEEYRKTHGAPDQPPVSGSEIRLLMDNVEKAKRIEKFMYKHYQDKVLPRIDKKWDIDQQIRDQEAITGSLAGPLRHLPWHRKLRNKFRRMVQQIKDSDKA